MGVPEKVKRLTNTALMPQNLKAFQHLANALAPKLSRGEVLAALAVRGLSIHAFAREFKLNPDKLRKRLSRARPMEELTDISKNHFFILDHRF